VLRTGTTVDEGQTRRGLTFGFQITPAIAIWKHDETGRRSLSHLAEAPSAVDINGRQERIVKSRQVDVGSRIKIPAHTQPQLLQPQ
jgi:hypothetical protein